MAEKKKANELTPMAEEWGGTSFAIEQANLREDTGGLGNPFTDHLCDRSGHDLFGHTPDPLPRKIIGEG